MFKETLWWMYIPFACLHPKMGKWMFDGDSYKERVHRWCFTLVNLYVTILICAFMMGYIINKFDL